MSCFRDDKEGAKRDDERSTEGKVADAVSALPKSGPDVWRESATVRGDTAQPLEDVLDSQGAGKRPGGSAQEAGVAVGLLSVDTFEELQGVMLQMKAYGAHVPMPQAAKRQQPVPGRPPSVPMMRVLQSAQTVPAAPPTAASGPPQAGAASTPTCVHPTAPATCALLLPAWPAAAAGPAER